MQPSFARNTRVAAIVIVAIAIGGLFVVALATASMHLLPLRFNAFAVLSLVTTFINLALFLFFIRKAARTEERTWLSLYLGLVIIYGLTEALQRLSGTPQGALFWYYAETPIVAVAPSIFLFALAYTNQSERRYTGTSTVLMIGALYLAFFYGFTNLVFIANPKLGSIAPWGWDFLKAIGPAISVALVWYDGFL